jgi:alcohol dehydrogenase
MKAVVVPAARARWEVKEIPTPEPGPNQVLIRIRASGLCYTDVHITHGAIPTTFPRTLGHEPVGDIAALGSAVTTRRVGDRVGVPWVQASCRRCEWCLRGQPMFCANSVGTGVQTQGSHAEYMLAEAAATVLLPEGLSYEQAAPIFCAGYTVYSGFRLAEPRPTDRVAVVGVGGLGHLGLQFAKATGHYTIAVTHSTDKEKQLRELGADAVVADGAALQKAGGADVILATGNSFDAVTDSIQALRPDGRVVLMGVEGKPLSVPTSILWVRGRIIGSSQNDPAHLYEALQLVASGKVKVITETYRLDDIVRAYDRVAEGKVRYRAVVVP